MAGHPGRARAPKKSLPEHIETRRAFRGDQLQPALDGAAAGKGHVFFADAAHSVYGTSLSRVWSILRLSVRAASGRRRSDVLGARNATTRQLLAVANTAVANADAVVELLRKIAGQRLAGPVTVVLDNAKYQRNKTVQAEAQALGIRLLDLPGYSPNLNLIERLRGFVKRRSISAKYHPDFASFRAAIETAPDGIPTAHAEAMASPMALRFQTFKNASLLAG